MNGLLVAATAFEITPFLDYYRAGKTGSGRPELDILISGIGLTATTYALSRQLQIKRPCFVIQAGVAGCFDKEIPLATVLAIRQEAIADQSVIELKKLKILFDLNGVPQYQYPFSKGWLVNKHDLLKKGRWRKVNGISVNQITVSKQATRFYTKEFNPVTESMEGAALHYVCLMEKIPFLQLRSISNYIGERNRKNWNMKESIINLNKELIRLLENL